MLGQRVVRGPDWKWGSQDGVEGRLGTIVEVGDGPSPSIPEKTVIVQWDGATRTNYRVGHGGAYDLRLYDNAPTGMKHVHVICDICRAQPIRGVRWKCQRCYDFDLCSRCYHDSKHSVNHDFWAVPLEEGPWIKVGPRSQAKKVKVSGFFPGATVARGNDWEWGDQDGGVGQNGKVIDIRGWGSESDRSVVTVRWPSGNSNVYRIGHRGKVDLKCLEAAEGSSYYKDHLPVLGRFAVTSPSTSPAPTPVSSSDSSPLFSPGDSVRVELEVDLLKQLQEGHGGWNPKMEEAIGKVGEVFRVTERGDVRVKYQLGGIETVWMFHPGSLSKIGSTKLEVGDRVQIINDIEDVKRLQEGHGDWADDMVYSLGMVGRVTKIYGDGDIRVEVNGSTWTYNPACAQKTTEPVSAATAPKGQGRSNSPSELSDMLAELLHGLGDRVGPSVLVSSAAEGNAERVSSLLAGNRDLVNSKSQGRTALQLACHQGHTEVVQALVDAGADLEMTDPDGDSALHFCCYGDEPDTAEIILKNGANVNSLNKTGSTPMHVAVNKNHVSCVRVLIKYKANLSCQDAYGDTPLHDSIAKDNIAVLDMLLDGKADPSVKNYRGFNALHHAALKGNSDASQRLLRRFAYLVNEQKDDGFSALHLAALNDHKDVARILLVQGDCDVNSRNTRQQTPLLLAVSQGHTKLIEVLVGFGADVDATDEDGDSALHIALMRHSISTGAASDLSLLEGVINALGKEWMGNNTGAAIACFLAQEGASLMLKNRRGKTALDLCTDSKVQGLVKQYARSKSEATYLGSLKEPLVIRTVSGPPAQSPMTTTAKPVPAPRSQRPRTASAASSISLTSLGSLDTCISCDNPPNVKFMPCGHVVMCVSCAAFVKRCVNPACKKPIESKVELEAAEEGPKCFVCDEETAVVVFEPCNHVITCLACSFRMRKCLECRQKITRKLHKGEEVTDGDQEGAGGNGVERECAICMERPKTIVFLCGHMACDMCAYRLKECHICRRPVEKRIQVFH